MEEAVQLEEEIKVLLSQIRESANDIFDTWSRNMLAGIRDQSLRQIQSIHSIHTHSYINHNF